LNVYFWLCCAKWARTSVRNFKTVPGKSKKSYIYDNRFRELPVSNYHLAN